MPAATSVEAMNDHMAVMISLTMVSTHPQESQSWHPAQRLPAWVDNTQVVPCIQQALQLLSDLLHAASLWEYITLPSFLQADCVSHVYQFAHSVLIAAQCAFCHDFLLRCQATAAYFALVYSVSHS